MADRITDYLVQVRRLLRDPQGNFWSDGQLTDYINEARGHVAVDSGCLRTLSTIYLETGVEFYSFGCVTGIQVTAGGSGYASAPTVTINSGSGAVAGTVTVTNGAVASIAVSAGGTLYTTAPDVVISGGGGFGATAYATLSAGAVNAIVVLDGGAGYTSTPTVTLVTKGSGATATATVSGGKVISITVTAQGSGYEDPPTVSFSSGAATATAYILPLNAVDLINGTIFWGNLRVQLRNRAFSDQSALERAWTVYKYTPYAYARYGQGLYIDPPCDQQYQMEMDTMTIARKIYGTTLGPINGPYTEAVKAWAAYLAQENEQNTDKAQHFIQLYASYATWTNQMYTRSLQSAYYDNANID